MRNEQLEIFISIVDCGSVSGAANRLNITQSTVSSSLTAMERELGRPLITRTRGQRTRLLPTEAGRMFYEYAQEVLRLYEKLRIRVLGAEGGDSVRIVAGQTLSVTLLAGMLKGLRRAVPDLTTSLLVRHVSTEEEILSAFSDTPCDFVFATRPVDDPALLCERILEDPIVLICNRSLDIGDSIELKQIASLPLVLREPTCATMIHLAHALQKNGLSPSDLNPSLTVYGTSAVREAVKYGSFCGFVPRTAYRPDEDMTRIRIVHVKGFESRRIVYLLQRKNAALRPELLLFRRFVLSSESRLEFAL